MPGSPNASNAFPVASGDEFVNYLIARANDRELFVFGAAEPTMGTDEQSTMPVSATASDANPVAAPAFGEPPSGDVSAAVVNDEVAGVNDRAGREPFGFGPTYDDFTGAGDLTTGQDPKRGRNTVRAKRPADDVCFNTNPSTTTAGSPDPKRGRIVVPAKGPVDGVCFNTNPSTTTAGSPERTIGAAEPTVTTQWGAPASGATAGNNVNAENVDPGSSGGFAMGMAPRPTKGRARHLGAGENTSDSFFNKTTYAITSLLDRQGAAAAKSSTSQPGSPFRFGTTGSTAATSTTTTTTAITGCQSGKREPDVYLTQDNPNAMLSGSVNAENVDPCPGANTNDMQFRRRAKIDPAWYKSGTRGTAGAASTTAFSSQNAFTVVNLGTSGGTAVGTSAPIATDAILMDGGAVGATSATGPPASMTVTAAAANSTTGSSHLNRANGTVTAPPTDATENALGPSPPEPTFGTAAPAVTTQSGTLAPSFTTAPAVMTTGEVLGDPWSLLTSVFARRIVKASKKYKIGSGATSMTAGAGTSNSSTEVSLPAPEGAAGTMQLPPSTTSATGTHGSILGTTHSTVAFPFTLPPTKAAPSVPPAVPESSLALAETAVDAPTNPTPATGTGEPAPAPTAVLLDHIRNANQNFVNEGAEVVKNWLNEVAGLLVEHSVNPLPLPQLAVTTFVAAAAAAASTAPSNASTRNEDEDEPGREPSP